MSDDVNSPKHYNVSDLEVITVIEDWGLGFHMGNVLKYVARAESKNKKQDLKKARWYMQRMLDQGAPFPKRESQFYGLLKTWKAELSTREVMQAWGYLDPQSLALVSLIGDVASGNQKESGKIALMLSILDPMIGVAT